MASQWQTSFIQFSQGVDTKRDPKALATGQLVELVNGELVDVNRIRKRRGYEALSNKIQGSSSDTASISQIAAAGSVLYGINDERDLYVWGVSQAGEGRWRNCRHGAAPVDVSRRPAIPLGPSGSRCFGAAQLNNRVLAVGLQYDDTSTVQAVARVFDAETGATLALKDDYASTTAWRGAFSSGSSLIGVGDNGSGTVFLTVANDIPATAGVSISSLTFLTGVSSYSPGSNNGDVGVIYWDGSDLKFTNTSLSTYTYTGSPPTPTIDPITLDDPSDDPYVLLFDGSDVYVNYNRSGTYTSVEAILNVVNMSLVHDGTDMWAYYTADDDIRRCTVTGGSVGTPELVAKGAGLYAWPFLYRGHIYTPISRRSIQQPTVALLRDTGEISAIIAAADAGSDKLSTFGVWGSSSPTATTDTAYKGLQTQKSTNTKFIIPIDVAATIGSRQSFSFDRSANLFVLQTIDQSPAVGSYAVLDMDPGFGIYSVSVGDDIDIFSGQLLAADQNEALPGQLTVFPELSLSAGSEPVADYQAVFEWIDSKGRLFRSAPSVPVTNTASLDVVSAFPPWGFGRRVVCKTYVPPEEGSPFQFVGQTEADDSTDTTAIYQPSSRPDPGTSEFVYTEGGELPNFVPPNAKACSAWRDRWALAVGSQVWLSKPRRPGLGFAFSDLLTVEVNSSEGDILAMGQLDERLVLLSRRSISAISGQGPDAAGRGRVQGPYKIASDGGISDPQSLVNTPNGIMFKNDRGIQTLTRSLQMDYTGAPVESFNSETIRKATLVRDRHQARFVTSGRRILVYDYLVGQWSVFQSDNILSGELNPIDSDEYNNVYHIVNDSGRVLAESGSVFTDNGETYSMRLKTAWISPWGPQGYGRIRRFGFLAEKLSNHEVTIKIRYDYNDTVVQTETLTVQSLVPDGQDGYRFRVRLDRQKCTAIQFEIEESLSSGTEEGFAISNLAIEWAPLSGVGRLESSRSL